MRDKILKMAKHLFGCDSARITEPCGMKFLIIGNTKTSSGEWYRDDKPMTFDFIEEKVVASGRTWKALWQSAKDYKKLLDMADDPWTPDRVKQVIDILKL